MKVHGDVYSGNCYKVLLTCRQLGLDCEWQVVDILQGETRQPAFLAKNPSGRVPLLELDDGRCLAESNAILHYLAEGSPLLPQDRWQRAQLLQWQFFEQYSHEPYIAVARFIRLYQGLPEARRFEYEALLPRGHAALSSMETHLSGRDWFVGGHYSLADISLYAYTHRAAEGGFALDDYPGIRAWLARVAEQPEHITMEEAARKVGQTSSPPGL